MKTTILVGLIAGALVSDVRASMAPFPPFLPASGQWLSSPDGRSLTFNETGRLRMMLPIDLELTGVQGLHAVITTDATALTIVAGRDRVRVDWDPSGTPTALNLPPRHGVGVGVAIGGEDVPAARGAWIRMLQGTEVEAVIEFERATYAIVERPAETEPEEPTAEDDDGDVPTASDGEEGEAESSVDRGWSQIFINGVPYVDPAKDVSASAVYQSAGRLHDAFECGDCNGTGLFAQRRNTGRERSGNGIVERERRTVYEPCEPCEATGYTTSDSSRRVMDTFVERFCLVEPTGTRYERGIGGQWAEAIREVLDINPARAGVINNVWRERQRDLQAIEIGTPMWLVGRVDFDRPVWLRDREDEQTRAVLAHNGSMTVIVLLTDPQIEHAVPGEDACLVGGLYAGVAKFDDSPMLPVIQGGFIVGR